MTNTKAALNTGFFTSKNNKVTVFTEIQVPFEYGECRFDFVVTTRPKLERNARYQYRGDLVNLYGFEAKRTKQDLIRDAKFTNYIGFVHYLYFAVPTHLIDICREKLVAHPNIGIVDIETMQVFRYAIRHDVRPSKLLLMTTQLLY